MKGDDGVATVGDLIAHLQRNFKPEERLCFWDEGGAYMNCEHVTKDMLGKMMFKSVRDEKQRRIRQYGDKPETIKEDFEFVGDGDVIVY